MEMVDMVNTRIQFSGHKSKSVNIFFKCSDFGLLVDVISSEEKAPAGRSTTSQRACKIENRIVNDVNDVNDMT